MFLALGSVVVNLKRTQPKSKKNNLLSSLLIVFKSSHNGFFYKFVAR